MSSEFLKNAESFYNLTPDDVMNGIEEAGFLPTGQFQQLNSYENRVFDIHLEKSAAAANRGPERVVAKFYRPGRWPKEALQDEHEFLRELQAEGVCAIAPLTLRDGSTLMQWQGLYFAVFPRFSGRMPQEFLPGELKQVGRTLARIHNIGAQRPAEHRPWVVTEEYEWQLDELESRVDPGLWPRYRDAVETILDFMDEHLNPDEFIRIHGDCHKGNLLQGSVNGRSDFFFVDFDDFLNGPVAQDFWMLLASGDEREKEEILAGYEELRQFPDEQFKLFEPLRGIRIMYYAAWIARRWQDPSFPKIFPDFGSYAYWAEEIENLEKIAWNL